MPVPFLDLSSSNESVMEDFLEDLKQHVETGQFIGGPTVQKFEETFAKFIGNKTCITVGSGSDALALALRAIGIGTNDEVVIPAFGYASVAEAVARLGGTPVFVDCRPDTYTLDPDKALASISSRTKAIVPVHIFGMAAEIDRLVMIARTYSVSVVEDVRQATGARMGSRRIGTFGEFGAFSFHPQNPLSAMGDGGALTSNNENLGGVVRRLREHGRLHEGPSEMVGYNSRLDAIQAALLLRKLTELDDNNAECIENARLYDKLFTGSPVRVPMFRDEGSSVYSSYVVLVSERDKLAEHLKEKNIGCGIPCPVPLHLQPAFSYLGYREGAFPIAEDLAKRCLALPIHPGLKKRQIEEVVEAVLAFYGVTA